MVAIAVVVGILTRWWVLSTPWGVLNADEAVTGLGAIDAIHGRFDVVIPGNAYTANLESYLFAPFVAVFGAHVTPLKLLPIVLWAGACIVLAMVVRRIAGALAGVVAGALLWLVPGALLVLSTRAYLAYAGGLLLVTASLVTLIGVLESEVPVARRSAVAGLFVGLAVWAHPMYLAVLIPACTVVGIRHLKRWRGWWLPAGASALVVNLPWIVWNLRHDYPSLAGEVVDDSRGTYLQRLGRFFSGLLPRDLGLLDQGGTRWIFGRPTSIAVYLMVLVVVGIGGLRLARSGRGGRMLAICLVAVWPIMAVFSPLGFVLDGRYGIGPTPLVFAALGIGVAELAQRAGRTRPTLTPVTSVAAVALWVAVLVVPYQWRIIGHHRVADPNASQAALIDFLDTNRIDYVAGSYWVVLPVTYFTNARIPSAVTPGFPIRYPHYQRIVEAADPSQVAFVFQPSDENPGALLQPPGGYDRVEVAGFIVYLPKSSR